MFLLLFFHINFRPPLLAPSLVFKYVQVSFSCNQRLTSDTTLRPTFTTLVPAISSEHTVLKKGQPPSYSQDHFPCLMHHSITLIKFSSFSQIWIFLHLSYHLTPIIIGGLENCKSILIERSGFSLTPSPLNIVSLEIF